MNVIIQKKGKVENLEKSGIIKLDKVMNNSTTIKNHKKCIINPWLN
ncbi:MAG: hypothetical protein UT33_C0003G0005 [Candidatus Peregrinibacteria bacterium GW2011_GWC2_39_14]|nr:MAG: hypothetical protein UT33_C0003G0005 [Candidatus Peregrinibacteria bacterium GW2011_GWC2_39_14]